VARCHSYSRSLKDRPRIGCRLLVQRHMTKISAKLLPDLTAWTAPVRLRAASLLTTVLEHLEDHATQHLLALINAMHSACKDDEATVVAQVLRAAQLLGRYVSMETLCGILVPDIDGSGPVGAARTVSALMLTGAVARGAGVAGRLTEAHIGTLARSISGDVALSQDMRTREELVLLLRSLIDVAAPLLGPFRTDFAFALISAGSSATLPHVVSLSATLLKRLADGVGAASTAAFLDPMVPALVERLGSGYPWDVHAAQKHIFDHLLVAAEAAIGLHLNLIMPLLLRALQPEIDAALRLSVLSMLVKLLENPLLTLNSAGLLSDHVDEFVRAGLLPNLSWRAGKTSAAIRTASMTCLWALMDSGVVYKEASAVMAVVLPGTLTCMEDESGSTRRIAVLVLQQVLRVCTLDGK
jgi:dynein assembly factor 5, axonemal